MKRAEEMERNAGSARVESQNQPGETAGAGAKPGGPEGPGGAPQAPGGLRLSGPARHALTVILALVVSVNGYLSYRALQPKPLPSTEARVRETGPGIPLYRSSQSKEPFHYLKPGSRVHLGDFRTVQGSRLPVHAHVDDAVVEGCIESKDLVFEDVERARRALESFK